MKINSTFSFFTAVSLLATTITQAQSSVSFVTGSSNTFQATGTSLTINANVPAAANFVVLTISQYHTAYPLSVNDITAAKTFSNGLTITTSTNSAMGIYYMANPGVGNHKLIIYTGAGNNTDLKATLSYYQGVDPQNPVASVATKKTQPGVPNNNPNLNVVSNAGQVVVDALMYERPVAANPANNAQSLIGDVTSNGWNIGSSYRPGNTGTVSMAWDYSSDAGAVWGMAAISLRGAPMGTLPVSVTDFSATHQDKTVQLKWSTLDDQSNNIELMRSTNGNDFNSIALFINNSSRSSQTASFTDNISQLGASKVYYRLKITEQSGAYSYSKIIAVNFETSQAINLNFSPNPVSSYTMIGFTSDHSSPATLQVIDLTGKTVQQKKFTAEQGTNQVMLSDLETLKSGTYIVRLTTDAVIQSQKLVKQ